MKRPYAYALILFAVAILGSLVWLHFQLVDRALAEAYELERETLRDAIAQSHEWQQEVVKEFDKLLTDDAKARFRSLRPVVAEAQEGLDELLGQYQLMGRNRWGAPLPEAEQRLMLRELANTLSLRLARIQKSYFTLLDRHGRDLDLSKEDVKTRKETIQNALAPITLRADDNLFSGNHFQRRDVLVLRFVNVMTNLINDLASITGGKTLTCFFGPKQYPFIGKAFENPRVGKPIDTYIGIGTYDDELDVRHLRVVVDGDTLRADSRSGLHYSFIPRKKGDQVLEMEMLYENPLTGLVSSRTHYYEYYVR